jgi:hypothetical protein
MNAANLWLDAECILLYKPINKAKLLINLIPEVVIVIQDDSLVNGIKAMCFG